tara:strand:+ start:5489 stop:6238 length:750 start_codon:yes stop_codon:yes gene_type:complete
MTLQNRINELFNKFNLSLSTVEKTELMAEATLENGTIIYTDAEGFEDGSEVYIVNEEGEKIPLPDGDYTLEDGRTLTIADSGKIAKSEGKGESKGEGEGNKADGNAPKTKAPAEAAPTPPAKKPPAKRAKSKQDKLAIEDEVIEEEKEVEEEVKEELMDDAYIIDLINRVLDERFPAEIVEEEMSAEDKAVTELKALLQAQTEELTELKSQAASEGVKRVSATKVTPQVDLSSLSTEDRVKALFTKYNS